MPNQDRIWKCECGECNCEEAAVKENQEIEAICHYCLEGVHRAERDYRASIETRKRIAKEESVLKERED